MKSALNINNLSKTYEGFKLDNVSINLPTGSIMGFIGANGAGKSTTIKLILDLISKESGTIEILGQKLSPNNSSLKEHIGVVLDESHFNPLLTVNNINTISKNIYTTWNESKFYELIERFGLPKKKANKAFSKGMKMKLMIAVALSHDSKILILDEPTSGLDPVIREEILEMLLEFIQDEQNSIFISSHITSDLEKTCDYITFIKDGKIILSDEKDMLLESYLIIKCSEEDYGKLEKTQVYGVKRNKFGLEVLVMKDALQKDYVTEKPSIEDIMLFFIKGVN